MGASAAVGVVLCYKLRYPGVVRLTPCLLRPQPPKTFFCAHVAALEEWFPALQGRPAHAFHQQPVTLILRSAKVTRKTVGGFRAVRACGS